MIRKIIQSMIELSMVKFGINGMIVRRQGKSLRFNASDITKDLEKFEASGGPRVGSRCGRRGGPGRGSRVPRHARHDVEVRN